MADMERFELRWDRELRAQVDAARGDVPLAVFVRRAVEAALAAPPAAPFVGGVPGGGLVESGRPLNVAKPSAPRYAGRPVVPPFQRGGKS